MTQAPTRRPHPIRRLGPAAIAIGLAAILSPDWATAAARTQSAKHHAAKHSSAKAKDAKPAIAQRLKALERQEAESRARAQKLAAQSTRLQTELDEQRRKLTDMATNVQKAKTRSTASKPNGRR